MGRRSPSVILVVGCAVPAAECALSLVDRLLTRVGARDSILEGKCTFLVELEETDAILRLATAASLAVIDELGRGTPRTTAPQSPAGCSTTCARRTAACACSRRTTKACSLAAPTMSSRCSGTRISFGSSTWPAACLLHLCPPLRSFARQTLYKPSSCCG